MTTMRRFATLVAISVALCAHYSLAFTSVPNVSRHECSKTSLHGSRRSFVSATACVAASFLLPSTPAFAIPSVTVSEFEQILQNSVSSIEVVEFAGPKSDIVTVKLVDGTAFGLSDVIESSTDPRSPLKLVATLRSYKVPCKFLTLENALSKTTKKKKSFANERVQLAAQKEKEKALRLAQDEAERQAELAKMDQSSQATN